MRRVTAQFLKHPDILHWGFEVIYLGEDEFGTWTALPAGTRRWKGETPVSPTRNDAVFCAPHRSWWHLHYSGGQDEAYTHFVDISTPPKWVGVDRYEMVDLDLDVAVLRDGSVVVEDEDEFLAHQVLYGYTQEMTRRAREETDRVVAALTEGAEPFFDVAGSWLDRSRS
ncbi:MAG: YgaC family protein [Actinobacteria bacterium]|nr:YgaC family protein [Actinomycetota bacterium]MCI0542964.1 YgaC family protein [Actinomycetota bacterium]MCI0678858.1 YgaC family protein [Actinomycetota bacterium]